MSAVITSERLTLRPWTASDADGALGIYGAPNVSRWLAPGATPLDTPAAMQSTLLRWRDQDEIDTGSVGHWAVETRAAQPRLVGGVSLQHAEAGIESLAIAWALEPTSWGHGYAAEAGDALIRWAIHERGVIEVFAIVQPDNARAAATAERIGMQWVMELGHLPEGRYQVYRIRHGDLAYRD